MESKRTLEIPTRTRPSRCGYNASQVSGRDPRIEPILNLDICKLLRSRDASVVASNGEHSVINLAMATWDPQIIKMLVAFGANMKAKDREGRLPLYYLANSSSAEVCAVISLS
jgi:hypothetical protein